MGACSMLTCGERCRICSSSVLTLTLCCAVLCCAVRPGGGPGGAEMEVTLSPEELEGLDNEGIRALYEAKLAAAQAAAAPEREDFSDLVAGHAAAQKRKIAAKADARAAKKQKESFKF